MYYMGTMAKREIYSLDINTRMVSIMNGYSMIMMTPQWEGNGRRKKNQMISTVSNDN
jgi:hypothetical protein